MALKQTDRRRTTLFARAAAIGISAALLGGLTSVPASAAGETGSRGHIKLDPSSPGRANASVNTLHVRPGQTVDITFGYDNWSIWDQFKGKDSGSGEFNLSQDLINFLAKWEADVYINGQSCRQAGGQGGTGVNYKPIDALGFVAQVRNTVFDLTKWEAIRDKLQATCTYTVPKDVRSDTITVGGEYRFSNFGGLFQDIKKATGELAIDQPAKPNAPTITTPGDGKKDVGPGDMFTGTAAPGVRVGFVVDDSPTGATATTKPNGTWELPFPKNVKLGLRNIQVRGTDPDTLQYADSPRRILDVLDHDTDAQANRLDLANLVGAIDGLKTHSDSTLGKLLDGLKNAFHKANGVGALDPDLYRELVGDLTKKLNALRDRLKDNSTESSDATGALRSGLNKAIDALSAAQQKDSGSARGPIRGLIQDFTKLGLASQLKDLQGQIDALKEAGADVGGLQGVFDGLKNGGTEAAVGGLKGDIGKARDAFAASLQKKWGDLEAAIQRWTGFVDGTLKPALEKGGFSQVTKDGVRAVTDSIDSTNIKNLEKKIANLKATYTKLTGQQA
ncbi:hypothetical protein [Amycolatopsis sp. cmx-11-12]|uniref:hypothetical protein n=1 Tax=Amycolatopsis sp. cmx-11-12 TaxID=2785795 RepID=UPI003918011E